TAPFDGIVIKGDLTQTLGAPVQRGEVLMVLAPDNRFRLVLEVDETDIGAVRPGQAGQLVLSSAPGAPMAFTVRRLVPVATTADGRNFFEVEAEVVADGAALRPGLSGVAKVEVGRRSLGGLLTYRLVDWARIASWSLLP
ncbi:MAG: HlyD family secretion protein, partial [Comamonadaceae bacterium]